MLTTIVILTASIIYSSNGLILKEPVITSVTEPVDHGEGPTWDPRTNTLYFVDVYAGRVLSYDYETHELNAIHLYGNTTPVVPTKTNPNVFIIGVERSIFVVEWNGKESIYSKTHLVTVSHQFPTSRINDGKADTKGRLLVGTIGFESDTGIAPNEGVLYSISKEDLNNPLPVFQPVNISNGIAWNKANNKFYYIDTLTFTIREFDYDIESGSISNAKVVFDVTQHENISGFPDGMTIDKDDNLWVALLQGGVIIKVNPETGQILQKITMPVQQVTSVAWGGPNLDILFATTSKHGLTPPEQTNQPLAGCLFAIQNLGTHGLPIEASVFNGPAVYQVAEPIDHGEGPTWDSRTNLLYFVDIFEGRALSYNYLTNELNAIYLHGNTTPIIPTKTNPCQFIVGIERSVSLIEWDGKETVFSKKALVTVSNQFPTSRFNDGKADKDGRLWIGTMGFESSAGVTPNEGVLYSISKNTLNEPLAVIRPVNVSNGMAWNKANNKFYYIDSPTLTVMEYDYDGQTGVISNSRIVFDLSKHTNLGGVPDGMTIDKDDNLWIALYFGGAVIKVDSKTGCLLQVIAIPAQCVTSVAWGGHHLDILFVTTSKHVLNASERIKQPAAGSLFAITNLGTHGLPMDYVDIVD
ncbi:hypothetical protein FQR65_LT08960 [Abscondita terminalis]|nr:hypothetical protein FQR65_LT08960 [Abscondita terminalis]